MRRNHSERRGAYSASHSSVSCPHVKPCVCCACAASLGLTRGAYQTNQLRVACNANCAPHRHRHCCHVEACGLGHCHPGWVGFQATRHVGTRESRSGDRGPGRGGSTASCTARKAAKPAGSSMVVGQWSRMGQDRAVAALPLGVRWVAGTCRLWCARHGVGPQASLTPIVPSHVAHSHQTGYCTTGLRPSPNAHSAAHAGAKLPTYASNPVSNTTLGRC